MNSEQIFAAVDESLQRHSIARRVCAFSVVASEAELPRHGLVSQRVLEYESPFLGAGLSSRDHADTAYDAVFSQCIAAEEAPVFAEMTREVGTRYAHKFDVEAFTTLRDQFVFGTKLVLVLDSLVWSDIVADAEFAGMYSATEKHDIAHSGVLGKLDGVLLVTDAFRLPAAKTIPRGTAFMCRIGVEDRFAGVRAWRGPVQAKAKTPDFGASVSTSTNTFEHKLSLVNVKPHQAVRFHRLVHGS